MARLKCPFEGCTTEASSGWHLGKHLTGTLDYGGHELTRVEAAEVVRMLERGVARADVMRRIVKMMQQRNESSTEE